jgi:excisionase family DNA binding protein
MNRYAQLPIDTLRLQKRCFVAMALSMPKNLSTKPAEEIFLTSKELTARWKVHTITLQRWVKNGRLPCVTIGGKFRRYRLSDVQRIEREGTN